MRGWLTRFAPNTGAKLYIPLPHTHTHTPHAVSDDMTLFPESQSRQFLMFLTRANRYPTLHLGGGDSLHTTKKVVLVEVGEVHILVHVLCPSVDGIKRLSMYTQPIIDKIFRFVRSPIAGRGPAAGGQIYQGFAAECIAGLRSAVYN